MTLTDVIEALLFSAQKPLSMLVMSSGNVRLHPFNSGAAVILKACPERVKRVEWETSLTFPLQAP